MDGNTGFLTFLMNFIGPLLLGAALAYLLISTRRARHDPVARNKTDRATEVLYEEEERDVREKEERRSQHP